MWPSHLVLGWQTVAIAQEPSERREEGRHSRWPLIKAPLQTPVPYEREEIDTTG